MKLIIDISEDTKNRLCFGVTYAKDIQTVCEALHNGIPLPKGHGRLIDADAYKKEMLDSREFDFFKRLDMQQTIIEADKAESER